jgi:RimJ/RimL family protein N-acetyltransferase
MEFNFDYKYTLEDDRVILRPLEYSDFDNLISFSTTEPEIWRYSLVDAVGENGLTNYLNLAINARKAKKEYPFIVFDKLTNSFAGCCRFYDIQLTTKCVLLGYTWYGKKFQGTGLNKHCKYLLLSFAFAEMGMVRVEFRADYENKRSISALKSIGCKEEGILRSNAIKNDGTRRDSIVMSILKPEWEINLKRELKSKLNHPTK